MAMDAEQSVSLSGLTEQEAKEFHGVFVASFTGFTLLAIFVHILTYIWKPWPYEGGAEGAAAIGDALPTLAALAAPFVG